MFFSHPWGRRLLAAAAIVFSVGAHAALLGVSPGEPVIDTPGDGIIDYSAATGSVTISGTPVTLIRNDPFLFGEFAVTGANDERLVQIRFSVNASGVLLSSGAAGEPGFRLVASIDTNFDGLPDYEGVLLEGDVTGFGFQDGGAVDDQFDLTVTLTGGTMRALYPNDRLALRVTSENSAEFPAPFSGGFNANFKGQAKLQIGAGELPPPSQPCKLAVDAFCSVAGGPFKTKCRIAQYKSPHFWEWEDRVSHGQPYKRYTYGLHGSEEPAWSRRRAHEATSVTFKYVITNVGGTPISELVIDDSFDTAVPGAPTALAAGQKVTLTRTERLRERLDNVVMVMGKNGELSCSAKDIVAVREKLREHRKHDDDRYRDKGKRDDD